MAPIRVALIGLSASAKTSWASDAHLPYLLSQRGRSHYTIVALLNSSVSAAEAAKSHYKLDTSVKCYGDPKALAADADVDLVVCNTRVDVHFPVTEPSLRAGKAVYIEWPITENLQKALELTKDVDVPNSIMGLQGRVAPITLRLKELLAAGVVGKVLSSEIRAYGNLVQRDALPESLTYFADRKIGGNPINIHFGHLLDYAHEVLGEFQPGTIQSRMQIQRQTRGVTGADGKEKGTIPSDVPDFLNVHGKLAPGKAIIADEATLVITYRTGPAFKGQPGFVWTINGEKGELRVTAPGPFLMSGHSYTGPIPIDLHDFATDEVRDMGWDWPEAQKELPLPARSVSEVYERYAHWVEGGKQNVNKGYDWPRLQDAVMRMREFDELYKQYDQNW